MKLNNDVSRIMLFGSIYLLCVSVVHIWSYWSKFGINIFVYMTVSDLIIAISSPIYINFLLITLCFIFGYFLEKKLVGNSGQKFEVNIEYHIFLIPILIAIAADIIFINILPNDLIYIDLLWILGALCVGSLISIPLMKYDFLNNEIKDKTLRNIAIFLICALPFYSYAQPYLQAKNIIHGISYRYINTDGLQIDKKIIKKNKILRYIGYSNQYIFFLDGDHSSVLIMKFDKIQPIKILQYSSKAYPFEGWLGDLRQKLSECPKI